MMEEEGARHYRQYPPALATYDEVVVNPQQFINTLEKLHAIMGTKFMVPVIGGKELDLHRLFVEVTSRGGIIKVVKDRKWREVIAVFNFPSTATNASYVLRKYYFSLLHLYEQIYFFGAKGCIPFPSTSLPSASSSTFPAQVSVEPVGPSSEPQLFSQKRRRRASDFSHEGCSVVGVIDGKFEHGYLVTVTIGTEKLKGVLYHTVEHPSVTTSRFSGMPSNSINGASAIPVVRRRRRRRKCEMRKRDPLHPKPNRSGYNFFFAEQHARLKPLHPGKDREISRMIGDLWNNLSGTEKAVYQERGLKDKERYQSEMEEYRERLRVGPINAVPIQQLPAMQEVVLKVDSDVKMEREGGLPEVLDNESSSNESEFEEEKVADKSSEVGGSSEGTGTEVGNEALEPSVDEDGFELSKRGDEGRKLSDLEHSSAVAPSESIKHVMTLDGK